MPYYLSPGDHLPLKALLLVLLYAAACYPLIYLVLPKVISGKWLQATAYILLFCSLLFIASNFLYWKIFVLIDTTSGTTQPRMAVTRYWPAINLGLMNFVKVAFAATIIKYVKYWWLKEKESQELEKEKINTDLQLLKAQINPTFLFKTLNDIYTHSISGSPLTSGMLLKLSDLLSYMLYECDLSMVPLEKEITMMKEYMHLEKIRNNDEHEMEVNIKGDLNGQMIAPFLLLPFIENSFSHCEKMKEQCWMNLDIRIENNYLSMKLTNGISEQFNDHLLINTNGLANVQKRLNLLYPDRHELKMTTEQEMNIVLLKLELDHTDADDVNKMKPATIHN